MSNKILFRASSVANLLVRGKGSGITEKQLVALGQYERKKTHSDLTKTQQNELDRLIAKRDKKPELGQTAKSYVKSVWLRREYGYDEPVVTNQMLKGHLCEGDALSLLSRQLPSKEFRSKNKKNFKDDFFTGTPDCPLYIEEVCEDVKCAWTIKTFVDPPKIDSLYLGQAQVYMHLLGFKKFRLVRVLLTTPEEIVREEIKRFWFKFGCDDENKDYLEAEAKIIRMHNYDHIPEEKRIKVTDIEYDPDYIEKLQKAVEMGREYYETLTL